MGIISPHTLTLILIFIFTLPHLLRALTHNCGCEPPSPEPLPPEPQPLAFLDRRLAVVYPIIQRFKATITSDPLGVTQTWIGSDICSYRGFYCDSPPDNSSATALASVDFNGFGLAAPSLDGFIDNLPDLALFHANSNNFSGTISPNISNLPFIYELDLSNNKFSGVFPASVLQISSLTFLDLRFNFFSGTVPSQVFKQTLDVLFINNNNFMQKLPAEFGSTPAFYLTFANNKFTGPIPRSIGNASSTLIEVLFLNNQLTGCLPYELGFLRNATVIDAGQNRLTGPLPCSLGCLEKIEQLSFAGNLLFGAVPEAVCKVASLVNLSLANNYFTMVGPVCRRLVKSGVLDLRKNCVPYLPDQRSPAECALFFRHPRYCPYLASYNNIPCKLPPHHGYAPPHNTPRPNRRLVSYSALERRRLR
ncbi:leucine-rich repeat (LRR) family protein [Actinidia rufa]|uniref:Leucine-rich repeat (LRR) family protein n=1 Tax=Actinidia rufa TaxID=165716 RepID=A0A7J0DQA7_9ERIC|nr:leucine-rich repeat (LRR) family protein [Actinidia rufa]